MSEVIVVPPGTIEPFFGLRIYSELSANVFTNNRGVVTIVTHQDIPLNNVIVIEDPTQARGYEFIVGDGNDTILAAPNGVDKFSRMTVRANGGNDFVITGANDDFVFGGEGKDRLLGVEGDDRLYGGADDDWLRGGDGDDILSGGICKTAKFLETTEHL
jgi:Ca2+-binding RTX toxin-like protein